MQMVNWHMKWCATSLIIIKMQIKTIMRYHLTSKDHIKLSTKRPQITKCWWGCRDTGTLVHCCWECKLIQPLWKTVWRFLKKTKNRNTIWSSNSPSGYISEEKETINLKRYMHPNVHNSINYNSQDMEAI